MKTRYIVIFLMACFLTSCTDFLEENPKGFLTTGTYYQNKVQTIAAVNGLYDGLDNWLVGAFGVAESPAWALEYITGYGVRPRTGNNDDFQFLNLTGIDDQNGYLMPFWSNSAYYPIENCNSVIEKIPTLNFLSDKEKNQFLGQAYFLRAHYYFQLVRLFGDVPLKLESTKDLENILIPKTSSSQVYEQIVADLKAAENSGLEWTDVSGRVNMGAVKSLLAKVYMTMAGYPLQLGQAYYDLAYQKSKEVIESDEFSLFPNYSDLRLQTNENTGEHIFMFQKMEEKNENLIHFSILPMISPPSHTISIQKSGGGALKPQQGFYNSYAAGDRRTEEKAYFYTKHERYDGKGTKSFDPHVYKYWDENAEISGRSGANVWNIRYADVLLLCAEAKTMSDGGTTTDQFAVDAYFEVRNRAFPAEAKPSSISFDQVYKERTWELCFEFQAWYDILRTRKIYDFVNDAVVDVIGYQSPGRSRAFEESDLLFPIPYAETVSNPLLAD